MSDARPVVALTGISGNLGRAIARVLREDHHVIGIDRRPFPDRPEDVELFQVDLRKRGLEDVFRRHKVARVIHMGIVHNPRSSSKEHHSFNVVGTTRVLECAARFGVEKVVFLSSASVYGPSPDNSNFLQEEAPLLAASRFAHIRDLIEVDMLAQRFIWSRPQVETVVLRPVHIVGRTIKNAPSNYLRLKRPWKLMGFDPMVQLIHVDDVSSAVRAALAPGVRGVFNVSGPGEAPLSQIFKTLGREPVSIPHPVARAMLKRLFALRLASYPPEELDHIQYLCAVDGGRFRREAKWAPSHTMLETVASIDFAP